MDFGPRGYYTLPVPAKKKPSKKRQAPFSVRLSAESLRKLRAMKHPHTWVREKIEAALRGEGVECRRR